jgi:hypothetical protein
VDDGASGSLVDVDSTFIFNILSVSRVSINDSIFDISHFLLVCCFI